MKNNVVYSHKRTLYRSQTKEQLQETSIWKNLSNITIDDKSKFPVITQSMIPCLKVNKNIKLKNTFSEICGYNKMKGMMNTRFRLMTSYGERKRGMG